MRIKILLAFGEAKEALSVKQIAVKMGDVPAKYTIMSRNLYELIFWN